ncbi:hypothetical protein B0T19DRAFT_9714 [Cercophora scortea]|uniref:Uncharacterized protein n=1 Tax=Cercophora scortea TaxID=314031 RepID=A0AAE0MK60_9PEZI|nr:hypothetical protein B0T19DRAFT_9714 [Cercophora scortea]
MPCINGIILDKTATHRRMVSGQDYCFQHGTISTQPQLYFFLFIFLFYSGRKGSLKDFAFFSPRYQLLSKSFSSFFFFIFFWTLVSRLSISVYTNTSQMGRGISGGDKGRRRRVGVCYSARVQHWAASDIPRGFCQGT